MTTLETRIYTYPPIPLADISPLEMLILTNVLECSETEAGLICSQISGRPIRSGWRTANWPMRIAPRRNLSRSQSISSSPAVFPPSCRRVVTWPKTTR